MDLTLEDFKQLLLSNYTLTRQVEQLTRQVEQLTRDNEQLRAQLTEQHDHQHLDGPR